MRQQKVTLSSEHVGTKVMISNIPGGIVRGPEGNVEIMGRLPSGSLVFFGHDNSDADGNYTSLAHHARRAVSADTPIVYLRLVHSTDEDYYKYDAFARIIGF